MNLLAGRLRKVEALQTQKKDWKQDSIIDSVDFSLKNP
jgi:hypothetical protein